MIETVLTKLLTDHKYNVFPKVAPFGTKLPYVTYHIYGGAPLVYMDNTEADKQPATVQINVFSDRIMTSSQMCKDITRQLLESPIITANPLSHPMDIEDEDPNNDIYGKSLDFEIWYSTN